MTRGSDGRWLPPVPRSCGRWRTSRCLIFISPRLASRTPLPAAQVQLPQARLPVTGVVCLVTTHLPVRKQRLLPPAPLHFTPSRPFRPPSDGQPHNLHPYSRPRPSAVPDHPHSHSTPTFAANSATQAPALASDAPTRTHAPPAAAATMLPSASLSPVPSFPIGISTPIVVPALLQLCSASSALLQMKS